MLNFDEEHVEANSPEIVNRKKFYSKETLIAGVIVTVYFFSASFISGLANNLNGALFNTQPAIVQIADNVVTNSDLQKGYTLSYSNVSQEDLDIIDKSTGLAEFSGKYYLINGSDSYIVSLGEETELGNRYSLYYINSMDILKSNGELSNVSGGWGKVINFNDEAYDKLKELYAAAGKPEGGPTDQAFLAEVVNKYNLFANKRYDCLSTGEKIWEPEESDDYCLETGLDKYGNIGFIVRNYSLPAENNIVYRTCDGFVGHYSISSLSLYIDALPTSVTGLDKNYLDEILTPEVLCRMNPELIGNLLEVPANGLSVSTNLYEPNPESDYTHFTVFDFDEAQFYNNFPPGDKPTEQMLNEYKVRIDGVDYDISSGYYYYDNSDSHVVVHLSDEVEFRINSADHEEEFGYLEGRGEVPLSTVFSNSNIKPHEDTKTFNLSFGEFIGRLYKSIVLNKTNTFSK